MNEKRFKYKKILVLGAGESGCGAAVLAKKHGLQAFVSDNGTIKKKHIDVLLLHGIDFEEGGHNKALGFDPDLVIKSPGIPDKVAIVTGFRESGIPVIDEIEFASWFTDAFIIAITGSNGKTTTTLLTTHLLQKAGLNAVAGGNIGTSFAQLVAEGQFDYYVLEVSSFQLDGTIDFRPDIAILLNITPDHLDRYDNDFQKYVDAKFRLIQNQNKNDAFIYWADDPVIAENIGKQKIKVKKYPFIIGSDVGLQGATMDKQNIVFNINKIRSEMTLEQLALQGKHNAHNSLASGLAAKLLQIRKETIKQGLSDFQNIAHRLEFVANVHGVSYINDSKATNVNATWYALESMERPVIWIAGGIDKGNDYASLMPLVKKKVKAIIGLGIDNSKLYEAFGDIIETFAQAESADEAVFIASNIARNNDVVLLSPACASFDLFENYEDRGNQFKTAVTRL